MHFERIGNWLQIAANIGIVVGLLLVGVQLQQNSDLLKIQLMYEESRRAMEIETLFPESEEAGQPVTQSRNDVRVGRGEIQV